MGHGPVDPGWPVTFARQIVLPEPPEDPFWEALARKLRRRQLERLTKGRFDIILDDLTLRELRRERRMTQHAMARALGAQQAQVSRLERRDDVLLSSLRAYVAALGGTLDLIARFPNGTFRIIGTRDTADPHRAASARAGSSARTRRRTTAAPRRRRSRR